MNSTEEALLFWIVVIVICILLAKKIRTFWCWYYRTTAILDKLDEIERKLKVITIQINQLEEKEKQAPDK
jgi:hypothetical protein